MGLKITNVCHEIYKEIVGKPLILWRKRDFGEAYRGIESLDIELVGECNLNCKSCTHFSPVAQTERLSVEEFEADLRQLSILMPDKIKKINLLGGEPLLHEQIEDFMKISRKYFPNIEICIVTNGILLLGKQESFWKTACENKIVIEVTKYPVKLDFKKMKETAKKYKVTLQFYGRSGYVQKTQYFLPLDLEGKQDMRESFTRCFMARSCITLYRGRLFPCSYAAYIERFNRRFGQDIPVTRDDYADIYNEKPEDIMKKIGCPVPMCRYCNVGARTYGNKWEVSRKKMEEWC